MTAASETETLSRETPALLPTPPEGALTTPLDASGPGRREGRGPQLVPQHQARLRRRLAGLHHLVLG